MMERGYGLPSPQPEIAERYYRLAAHGGNEEAEIELARRLLAGRMLVKPENGSNEAIDLLNRALSHGSARAANMLAEIYRNGELDQPKDPLLAMKYAFLAIKLSVQADPTTPDGNPFFEINAGILLAEMAVNGQAVDVNDRGFAYSRRNRPPAALLRGRRPGNPQGKNTPARRSARRLQLPLQESGVGVGLGTRGIADRAAVPQPGARDVLLRQRRSAPNAVRHRSRRRARRKCLSPT